MKHITGMKEKDRQTSGSLDKANQYNQFFYRFSSSPVTPPTPPDPHTLTLSQMVRPSPQHSSVQQLSTFPPLLPPHPLLLLHWWHLHQPLPNGDYRPGKEAAGKTASTKVCRPWWHLTQDPEDLCQPAVSCTGTSVQPEPVSGESPVAVKDLLFGPSPQKVEAIRPDRPVARTLHVMKVLERLVLAQLRSQVRTFLDHLQFAYQPHLVQLWVMSPAEVFWWLSCYRVYKRWRGGWVQDTGRQLCRVVRTESPEAECQQDQRDSDRLREDEEDAFTATTDQGGGGGGL